MPKENESDSSRTQLILGILGFAGVILTILAGIFTPIIQERLRASNATATIVAAMEATATQTLTPMPTDTVPPGADTSTPAPTDTPAPTSTDTPIPILAAGEDWKAGCVSTVWQAYPSSTQPDSLGGCLITPFNQFYTTGGKLAFNYNNAVGTAEVYGVFTRLPSDGNAELNVAMTSVVNGEILVGVFASPEISFGGAMIIFPATNNPDRNKILFKTMPGFVDFSQSSGPVDSFGGSFNIRFSFDSGEVGVKVQNGQINLGSIPVVSAEKWLFIGYRALIGGNQLKAEFSDLTITR